MLYALIAICSLTITIHFIYYVIVFRLYRFTPSKKNIPTKKPVSVIVCAKNEELNLKKLVPKLLSQKYDEFEIVLINDCSYDDTENVIDQFEKEHINIKAVHVAENETFIGKKKFALTLGIKAATHDCLLFTDADCLPVDDFWIENMAKQFTSSKEIVLGYSPYQNIRNSFLNKIIRYETLITAVQYFSYALWKNPYMGVGRNLMYSKALFFKHSGFSKHMQIISGDDDLFVNETATSKNTTISIEPNSFMISEPKTSLKSFIQQKRRHVSTAKHYKTKHQFLLGAYASNRVLFWIIFPLSFCIITSKIHLIYLGALVSIKFITEYIFVGISAKKLQEKTIILLIPFLDLVLLLLQLYVFICNLFVKPKRW